MRTLKLNDSGDLEFDNLHNLKMIEDVQEVKQRNRLSLGTNKGEWFLNKLFGIPWIEMLSEREPPERFRADIVKVLNNDPAIDEVVNIDIDYDRSKRSLEIEFIAIIDGERIKERVVI